MVTVPSPTQRFVPAWKRLGLKLKNDQGDDIETSNIRSSETTESPARNKKRKASEIAGTRAVSNVPSEYEPHRENQAPHVSGQPQRKKSVTFARDSKDLDGDANARLLEDFAAEQNGGENQFTQTEIAQFTAPKSHPANYNLTTGSDQQSAVADGPPKKLKDRSKRAETSDQPHVDPAYVHYLKEYRDARGSWKFNKSHQIKLLNNIFNTHRVPPELDDAVSSYLSGLQGEAARNRLEIEAKKILSDTDDAGRSSAAAAATAAAAMSEGPDFDAAKHKALKTQLKQTKSIMRNREAAENASTDDHGEKLRKRRRAELVLSKLGLPPSATPLAENGVAQADEAADGQARKRRRKSRIAKGLRTGVPDDDDTDDTSSVSSVPSSTLKEDPKSRTGTNGTSDADSGSDASSSDVSSSSSDESSSDSGSSGSDSESEDESN